MFVVGCSKPSRHGYDIQCAVTKYNRCKKTVISISRLPFVIVSKCLIKCLNSKLSLKVYVTRDKARLKNLSSAFDDSNEHEIK